MSAASMNAKKASEAPLNHNQIRGFWAAWGGWALDGMDSFIYALVLVPSLRDLLPRSGIPATKGAIGYYGGLLFALFLIGCAGHERGTVGHPSFARRNRHWRRVGHGRHVRRGRVARATTSRRRGLHAYRILRGNLFRGSFQLRDWQPLWTQRMARHVRRGRIARAVACGGASRRDGAFALESERGRRAFVGDLAAVCGAIFKSGAARSSTLCLCSCPFADCGPAPCMCPLR